MKNKLNKTNTNEKFEESNTSIFAIEKTLMDKEIYIIAQFEDKNNEKHHLRSSYLDLSKYN